MDSFQIVDEIASGVYGTVFRAKRCSDGEAVALKRMDITCENGGLPYYLIREWAIMKVLRNHPRIAGFRSMILPDEANPKFCMEMELCVMNLYDYARQYEPRISTRRRYLKEMLEALAFIHSQGVLHRDIKPENILLTHNRQIKLADFGLSRFYHVPLRQYTMNVASRWWRAPELMLGEFKYGPASDVWSMALIFVEVVTGRSPWRGKNNVDQLFHIFRDLGVPKHKGALSGLDRSAFPDWHGRPISRLVPGLSPVGCHLLSQMLEIDPHQRILAADALKHPFFWESVPSVTPRKNRKRARSCSPPPYRPYTRIRHCTRQQQSCTQFTRPRCDGGAPEQTNSSFLPFPRQTEAETIVQQRLLSQDLLTPMRFRTTNVHGPVHYFEKGRSVFDALLYLQKHLEMSMETVHLAFSLVSTMEARGRLGDDWRSMLRGCSIAVLSNSSVERYRPRTKWQRCTMCHRCASNRQSTIASRHWTVILPQPRTLTSFGTTLGASVLHQVPRTEMVVVPGRRVAGVRARRTGRTPRRCWARLPFECTSVGATSREGGRVCSTGRLATKRARCLSWRRK